MPLSPLHHQKQKLEAKTDIQSQELRRLEEDLTCTFGPEVVARQLMEDLVSFMESSADLDDIENTVEHTKQDIREALEIVQPSGGVERLVNLSPEDSEILCEILSGIEISLIEHTTKLKLHRQRQSTLKPHWSSYAPLAIGSAECCAFCQAYARVKRRNGEGVEHNSRTYSRQS